MDILRSERKYNKVKNLGIIIIFLELLYLVFPQIIYGQQYKTEKEQINSIIKGFIESSSRDRWQKPEYVINLFGDLKGKKILDLGCGQGYFTFRLALAGANVVAADVNDDLTSQVKSRLTNEEYDLLNSKIEFRTILPDDAQLEHNEVDGILLVNTYHHLENRIEYFKNLLNGINDGSKVVIVDFKKESNYGPPRDHKIELGVVLTELDEVGFSELEVDEKTLDYQYVILCTK